jgi:hypothetical protein
VGPGQVWTGSENHAQSAIRSPDRTARSDWLYRPRYAGLHKHLRWFIKSQMFAVIQLPVTHSKLPVNVILMIIFGCKIEPSSGHYTRTVKSEDLCIIRVDSSPFTSKGTL